MIEQWQELKETIIEMRDNDGTGTQQEVCKFLANLMELLEKQMQESKTEKVIKMRDATPEERELVDKYIKGISKPIGVDFWDLEQEPSRDIEEIKEIMECDTDAETKCKMISNILTAKPHYFEKQDPKYCDRNICVKNEYNNISCDECEVTKSQRQWQESDSKE